MDHLSVIGIDLGGTKCVISRIGCAEMEEQQSITFPTNAERGFPAVLVDVVTRANTLITPDTKAIGIGVPGLVRSTDGYLVHAPNIREASDVPLQHILSKAFNLPVAVSNDVSLFTLAEACCGAGKGKSVVVGIAMGTGVGGGIVIDGKLFHGSHGFAGEIGHMLLKPGDPPYGTRNKRGEVEQFLSGTAFGRRCSEAQKPEEYLEGAVCEWMQPEVFKEVAWLITNLTHLLDPDLIVFGGSAGRALKPHLPKIKVELLQWLLPGTPLPDIAMAALPNAGVVGAGLSAMLTVDLNRQLTSDHNVSSHKYV